MVKPVDVARRHLEEALTYIATRYRDGVTTATWKEHTLKAAQTWKQAIAKAAQEGRWEKGIQAASDEEWRQRALEAADILPQRLREAIDKWEQNWRPKYEAVARVVETLPPRTTDWNTNIEQRLKPVVAAWKGQRPR